MLEDEMQPQKRRRGRPLVLFGGLALLIFLIIRRSKPDAALNAQASEGGTEERTSDPPWPKIKTLNSLETLWEVPRKVKGVLFVAHGCSHSGSDFWPNSQRCPHCLGLPEEVGVRSAALKRGYAVVAVTSYNRESKCWHNTQASRSEDLKRLPSILRQVMQDEGLESLPLLAFGASSGGSLVLRLAAVMPEVKGVICQITPVNPSVLEVEGGKRHFPPTVFVHMAQRDPDKAATVTAAMKVLKKAGTPAIEVKVAPQAVTAALLQRSDQISKKQAKAIVAALKKGGALDKRGLLKLDPRSSASTWRQLVQPVAGDLSLEPDVSQVGEIFNVAYARHEIVSEGTAAALAWLEAGGKGKKLG